MTKRENENRLERRSVPVRELRVEKEDGKIAGYAAVFDEEADIGGMFREIVRPGAFKRAIKEKQDVRALWNHDPNHILGRTKSSTLTIEEDEHGLWIEIDPPDTQFARDLVESIRRGDIDQMSFAFRTIEEKWTERGEDGLPGREIVSAEPILVAVIPERGGSDGERSNKKDEPPLRELLDVDLFDISPVTYPAYEGTEVGLRSAESVYQEHVQSLEGQAPEGDDEPEPKRQVPSDPDFVTDEILNL